ncbi:unnamed protein product [Brachionus calyciflorus]|uniref:Cytochrome p450 CYP3044B6 n=1 Tax=Brachionus calyciflorus TaxID=104777 RepID=A0A2H4PSH2_9BILA|nr:cytochrome p450 CYP3044B6 [Brachionus calyciflorus]CAF1067416.1 unnamed protein product [Brachionus calyciflorus]
MLRVLSGLSLTKNSILILVSTSLVFVSTSIFLKWLRMCHHFKKRKIPGPRPIPILGNFHHIIKRGMPYNDLAMIKKYGKTFGYFEGSTPVVETTDTQLLKSILIKDFNLFINRRVIEAINFEPFDHFLTLIKDDEWKNVRAILSTMFTSGKLKSMSELMINCTNELNKHFKNLTDGDGIFYVRDYFGGLSLNVICSCCFGFSIDSIKEPKNEVIVHIKKFFFDSLTKDPKFILLILFPKFANFLRQKNILEIIPKDSMNYLKALISEIIERRKNKLEFRDDFIQTMIEHEQIMTEENKSLPESEKKLSKTLSPAEIFSQAVMLLLAGYETTANTLGFIAYNLATHDIYQEKLIEEVDNVLSNYNGKISYESISEMKFMNMIIDETLRMFPPAIRTNRIASQDYEFNGMMIEKGQMVVVPIWALHYDPVIYPNPEIFDPERFNEENKRNRENSAYMPFGIGPRNCLGMRFALIEIKLALAEILSKFRFERCERTPEKIEIDSSGLARPKKPIVLRIRNRF